MSSSRKRTEHIERTRYPNPLPPPPYPPKFLSIPTEPSRYADPTVFGQRLASAHPLPVVVDSEAGMPLNLSDFPQACYTDQELEANDDVFPKLEPGVEIDDEDAFLLSDLLSKVPSTANGTSTDAAHTNDRGGVTWLRRTEYISAEQQKRRREEMANKSRGEVIDASREAQIARIEESFAISNSPIESLRHPTKPNLQAVDEYSLLPDADTWATQYDIFRFGDPAGRVQDNTPLHDPRLQVAVLRPHRDLLNNPIYSLFLVNAPESSFEEEANDIGQSSAVHKASFRSRDEQIRLEDEEARRLLASRVAGEDSDATVQDSQEAPFDIVENQDKPVHMVHVRDYQAHDQSTRKDQELLLTFLDQPSILSRELPSDSRESVLPPVTSFERAYRKGGSLLADGVEGGKRKAVFYHPVTSRSQLRVQRRKANDLRPPEHWDAISLSKRSLSLYEKVDRLYERHNIDDLDDSRLPARIELPAEELEEDVHLLEKESEKSEQEQKSAGESEREEPKDNASTTEKDVSGNSNASSGEEDGNESNASSDSASAGSDEEMEDDELAALREEAGADADNNEGENQERARRSRRRTVEDAHDIAGLASRNVDLGGDSEDD